MISGNNITLWYGYTPEGELKFGLVQKKINKMERASINMQGVFGIKTFKIPARIHSDYISTKDLILFCEALGDMMDAGLELSKALEKIMINSDNLTVKFLSASILNNVVRGYSGYEAFSSMKGRLPSEFIRCAGAGSMTGKLPVILRQLSSHYTDLLATSSTLKKSLRYPIVLLVFLIIVYGFVLTTVIPGQRSLLTVQSEVELPALTKIVYSISDWFIFNLQELIGFFALFCIPFLVSSFRNKISRFLFKIFMGPAGKYWEAFRFSSSMGILLSSGISTDKAFEFLIQSSDGESQKNYRKMLDSINAGFSLKDVIRRFGSFPEEFHDHLDNIDITGKAWKVFERISEEMLKLLQKKLQTISKFLPNILLALAAIGIFFLVAAIYQPVLSVGGLLKD